MQSCALIYFNDKKNIFASQMHSNQKLFSFITCQKIENCWKNKFYRKITESFFALVPVKSQNSQMRSNEVARMKHKAHF